MSKDISAEIGFSFEAVLDAVQESSRGRWFLEEFKKRNGHFDSAKMMDAIGRIELRVDGMAGHFTAAEDLAKVRAAIAKTRSDILNAQPEAKGLSEEGRLFAHLADLARKAMPEQSSPAGIEQALRLVDQIDTSLNSNVMVFPSSAAKPQDRFFQQDAAVFEQKPTPVVAAKPIVAPEPAPVPAAKPIATKPAAEPAATGAKLTITRVAHNTVVAAPAAPEPKVQAVAAETPAPKPSIDLPMKAEIVPEIAKPAVNTPTTIKAPEPPKSEAGEAAKPRIVIIRRKPEEAVELPTSLQASTAA